MTGRAGQSGSPDRQRSRDWRRGGVWCAIFMLAMSVRIVELFAGGMWKTPLRSEPTEEVMLAQSLADDKGYTTPFRAAGDPSHPSAFSPPGYPYLLAGFIRASRLVSREPLLPYRLVLLFGIVLGAAGVLLLAIAADKTFGPAAFWWVGVLGSVWPIMVRNSVLLWDTPFVIFGACVGVLLAALSSRSASSPVPPGVATCAFLGIHLGVQTLSNPVIAPFVGLASAAFIFRKGMVGRFVASLVLMGLVFVVVVGPWFAWTTATFHRFMPVRNSLGFNVWVGNLPDADGTSAGTYPHQPINNLEEQRLVARLGEDGYMRMRDGDSARMVGSDPKRFLRLTARRAALFWFGDFHRSSRVLGFDVPLLFGGNVLKALGNVGLLSLAVWGACRWGMNIGLAVCLFGLLLLPLPYYVTHVSPNYRVVVDPILCFLSAGVVKDRFAVGWFRRTAV